MSDGGSNKDYYKKPNMATVLMALNAKPSDDKRPIPETLTEIVENVIRGVAMVAREGVPSDRQMKALQIALEILKDSPQMAEALGRHNPFAPTLAAALEESSSQRQTIARLRTIYAQAKLPDRDSGVAEDSQVAAKPAPKAKKGAK